MLYTLNDRDMAALCRRFPKSHRDHDKEVRRATIGITDLHAMIDDGEDKRLAVDNLAVSVFCTWLYRAADLIANIEPREIVSLNALEKAVSDKQMELDDFSSEAIKKTTRVDFGADKSWLMLVQSAFGAIYRHMQEERHAAEWHDKVRIKQHAESANQITQNNLRRFKEWDEGQVSRQQEHQELESMRYAKYRETIDQLLADHNDKVATLVQAEEDSASLFDDAPEIPMLELPAFIPGPPYVALLKPVPQPEPAPLLPAPSFPPAHLVENTALWQGFIEKATAYDVWRFRQDVLDEASARIEQDIDALIMNERGDYMGDAVLPCAKAVGAHWRKMHMSAILSESSLINQTIEAVATVSH